MSESDTLDVKHIEKKEYDDNTFMSFGKYKGRRLKDVPDSYLYWLFEHTDCEKLLKDYAENRLEGYDPNGDTHNDYDYDY